MPPRPIAPGDVVTGYSDELGEWAAVQVTHLDPERKRAGILDLDWSGDEPEDLADLGPLVPLRLTHHRHPGRLSHCNFGWLLPRGCRVLGNAPLLVEQPSNAYSGRWPLGLQLDLQRRWDAGDRESRSRTPGRRSLTARELAALDGPLDGVWALDFTEVDDVDGLDCAAVVARAPRVTRLSIGGTFGSLRNAGALNELADLRLLSLHDVFGMTAADCPRPDALPHLEYLWIDGVPAEYAAATKRLWRPQIAHGTDLEVRGARKPGWIEENRDNPLRGWDGSEHISPARYRKAVTQYRETRAAVVGALREGADDIRLVTLGAEYAEAFNRLDGPRSPFITTVEREDLFEALAAAVRFAESTLGTSFPGAVDLLHQGAEDVREW